MKIVLVHYSYPPIIGGVERVMEEQARLFLRHGHEVWVACQRGGDPASAAPKVLPLPLDDAPAVQAAALRPALAGAALVLVHNVMTMPFHAGLALALEQLAAECHGTRFVAWVHDAAACNPDYSQVPEWARRRHAHFEYAAVSPLRRRQWLEVSGAESTLVPNGIDPARILGLPPALAEFAATHDLLDGRLLLLHPTRLLRRKNVELSMRAAAALRQAGQPATLLVTGAADPHNAASADYASWLLAERDRLCADVHFLGKELAATDEALAALYRLADAVLFPSRQEGFGLPVLEAAILGVPIFHSAIEPLTDLPSLASHRFPASATPESVAEAIAKSMDTCPRRALRKQTLEHYRWDAIWHQHLEPLIQRPSPE